MHTLAGALAVAAAVVAAVPAGSAQPPEPTHKEWLGAVQRQLTAAREAAGPGVVWVVTSRSDKYPPPPTPPAHPGELGGFDPAAAVRADAGKADLAARLDLSDPRRMPDLGFAGGIVVDATGLVLTNYHTIDGATKIYVHLSGGKGSYADIRAADSRSDLAVLKLLDPPPGLAPVKFGDVRLADGAAGKATVYPGRLVTLLPSPAAAGAAVGPRGGGLGPVTGVFQKKAPPETGGFFRRDAPPHRSIYNYARVVLHNVQPDFGCSGLPLVNLDGEVVALTTTAAGLDGVDRGTGQALPFESNLRRVVRVLCRGEEVEYGLLGVTIKPGGGFEGGVHVGVTPQSPAAAAGLLPEGQASYLLKEVDGHPITSYEDLLLYAGMALAGNDIEVVAQRFGDAHPLPRRVVTLGKYGGDPPPFIASVRPPPVFGLRVDYGSVLSRAAGPGPGGRADPGVPPGVAVRELGPGSPAAAAFKSAEVTGRWLVTHVNGAAVPTPKDFYRAAAGQAAVKLTVVDLDTGARQTVALP